MDLHIESMPSLYPQINASGLAVDPFQIAPTFPWLNNNDMSEQSGSSHVSAENTSTPTTNVLRNTNGTPSQNGMLLNSPAVPPMMPPGVPVHNMSLALLTAAAMNHPSDSANMLAGRMKLPLPSKEMSVAIVSAQKAQQEPVDPEQAKKDRNSAATARFRKKRREELLEMEQKAVEAAQKEVGLQANLDILLREKQSLQDEWDVLMRTPIRS
ncbi:hypothetical protein SARC_06476 [Sphaeroforma arctica JP610]|uniref:BZIP domain-containing protein n=1 Tax=Sphaeroforma arctica JP610 TaxID=667725 RepID=A0A0L0FZ07_9EUKA|nr:hypothetical protein SARC_06476 [Sphaeroforma arctica JP610]KNC81193.1 hypothetical protein SARC_06476 [Sphaeroforma arctica JP610]|eukprot:XP_014155095.1 hypothetical protein SARC_06476 [Sphaeroforma arctica JP610]